jgi:hypothetical protein
MWVGCGPESVGDTGFRVVASVPVDGADDATETQVPELRLSEPGDATTCQPPNVGLVQVDDDGGIVRTVPVQVELLDEGNKLALQPAGLLRSGAHYAYVVRSGSAGCTDTTGRVLRPFSAGFTVQ